MCDQQNSEVVKEVVRGVLRTLRGLPPIFALASGAVVDAIIILENSDLLRQLRLSSRDLIETVEALERNAESLHLEVARLRKIADGVLDEESGRDGQ